MVYWPCVCVGRILRVRKVWSCCCWWVHGIFRFTHFVHTRMDACVCVCVLSCYPNRKLNVCFSCCCCLCIVRTHYIFLNKKKHTYWYVVVFLFSLTLIPFHGITVGSTTTTIFFGVRSSHKSLPLRLSHNRATDNNNTTTIALRYTTRLFFVVDVVVVVSRRCRVVFFFPSSVVVLCVRRGSSSLPFELIL